MPARLETELALASDSRHARQIARRKLIAQLVAEKGAIRIEDLTTRFAISLMTAHRDIDDLAARGLILKTRGLVAAPQPSAALNPELSCDRKLAEKRAIATAACAHITSGQTVFFDDSTTVFEMLPQLPRQVPLTAITNSLTLINALRNIPDIDLLGLGGYFQAWNNSFMGAVTCNELRRLRADLLFMSPAAISDGQAFHQSPELAAVKRAMFDSAAKRILLADSSKFDRRALHSMSDLREFDLVITDSGLNETTADHLRRKGVSLQICVL